MCDEAKLARWAREGLNRRQFGALGGMAAVAACAPVDGADEGDTAAASAGSTAWNEQAVAFETADGRMDGWLVAPTTGAAPAVLLWPDIAGLRESKKAMARRLAGRGYAVLVANQYYRDTTAPIWQDFADFAGNGGWPKAREMRGKLDAEAIMRDARAAIAWLDTRPEVDSARGVGTQGYCMGGPFAMWTAAAVPDRVRAAASFHGGGLVREDAPLSPHKLFDVMRAALLIAVAQDDDREKPEEKAVLRRAADAAGREATIEVFAGDHGWCVPDSPAYAKDEAERAWTALLAMYDANLRA